MSKKRKRGRSSNPLKKIKRKVIEVQTPLAEEVSNITTRIQEEERVIYELEKRKVKDRWGSHRSFEGSINN